MHAGATQVAASTLFNDKDLCEIDIATLITAASFRVLAIVPLLLCFSKSRSGRPVNAKILNTCRPLSEDLQATQTALARLYLIR